MMAADNPIPFRIRACDVAWIVRLPRTTWPGRRAGADARAAVFSGVFRQPRGGDVAAAGSSRWDTRQA